MKFHSLQPASQTIPDMPPQQESWMQKVEGKVAPAISANERISLSALISHVALHLGENEFRVERRLADRFHIANVTCLPTAEFDNALRYLTGALPSN